MAPTEESRARLRRRLAVVVDESRTYQIRIAAIRAVQGSLAASNPLRYRPADELLDEIKPSWATRLFLVNGRGSERKVLRPPEALSDVW